MKCWPTHTLVRLASLILLWSMLILLPWQLAVGSPEENLEEAEAESEVADADSGAPVVVEMFTSIGCINCGLASSGLREIQDGADKVGSKVFTLSYHVNYATSTGLLDPFAKKEFSEYQQEYARHFKKNKVAVPETVINGSAVFPALEFKKIHRAMDLARLGPTRIKLHVEAVPTDNEAGVRVKYTLSGISKVRRTLSYLRLALVQRRANEELVDVDNHMRKFTHTNVVRRFQSVRITGDGTGQMDFVLPENLKREEAGVIAFLQDYKTFAVLAAHGFAVEE